ncbi:MAG: ABC transporter ATP-binding protein [Magnetococcales bacterium]|nr:ABC transporter ATP-binding protein [Magnetococcales bacterium]
MLTVDRLSFEYPGVRALEEVSWELPAGAITALVGPNGSGKSTLLRCLVGLAEPFSGEVRFQGRPILEDPRRYHARLGYLADDFGLYDDLTVERCLILAARRHRVAAAALSQMVTEAVELLGLQEHRKTLAGRLSRGWRQRLGIAQAIIHRPSLLFLDEPASGLDPESRIGLADLLLSLHERGMTILVSSHILAELDAYSHYMVVLRAGRLMGIEALDRAGRRGGRVLRLALSRVWPPLLETLRQLGVEASPDAGGLGAVFPFVGDVEAQAGLLRQLIVKESPVAALWEEKVDLQSVYLRRFASRPGATGTEPVRVDAGRSPGAGGIPGV